MAEGVADEDEEDVVFAPFLYPEENLAFQSYRGVGSGLATNAVGGTNFIVLVAGHPILTVATYIT